ncbi:MAG: polymorphic toxin-type HINT domain-containing protein [Actinomycetales bacterium]
MADGSKKPIDQVQVGDEVLATDPETGEQAAKKVQQVFVHDDALTDLQLVDGTVLTTTEDHPYWSVDDRRFERADELAASERVLGTDGRTVEVSGLQLATTHEGRAYNLSVEGIHTYHVGDNEVIVHNACGPTLIYEANPKHGPVSRPGPRGEISRAPRGDCQARLECSVQVGPRLREGVEPETGLKVVFRQHREFEGTEWWHGYVPGG